MIPKICLFALVSVLLLALLDRLGFKSKGLVAVLCALIMLISLTEGLSFGLSGIINLAERAGITEGAKCVLKAVGLGYVFGFTAEICSSLGEGVISSVVTVAGRVQIFLVAYPYFEKIVKLGVELLE